MSEYQYYEFRAVDRPLDQRAQTALRAISSRAEITSTSLINVYHFGDFKGSPDRLMEQYFDAHLYVANWGTRRLMLRVPARSFRLATAKPYEMEFGWRVWAKGEHVIFEFSSEDESGDDFDEGDGWLASLLPLRSDLMAGDLRCLYLSWLAGVAVGEVGEQELEPPVPPGLGQLSAALERFTEFIRLDPDLIAAAAELSDDVALEGPAAEELAAWVAAIPRVEADGYLIRLMHGDGTVLTGELLQRFREEQARRNKTQPTKTGRTAGDLLAARDRMAENRRRQEEARAAKKQAKQAREQAAAKAKHLASLTGREEELWQQAEAGIQTRQPQGYGRAIELLKDLRDLGEHHGTQESVLSRLRALRERHSSKTALLRRLDQAGLPK